jgi:hypothetical protein
VRTTIIAQVAAIAIALIAVVLDDRLLVGAIAIVAIAVFQIQQSTTPPTSAKALGFAQMGVGFALVAATAAGVLAA